MAFYLGFDASTQSLTATLIAAEGARHEIVRERSFTYDEALPQYATRHGVLASRDPSVVVSPPLMWVDALDVMMADLIAAEPHAMAMLAAVSGSAQQHGSVYLNERALPRLASASGRLTLAVQIADVLSRQFAPVWMDSSTSEECRELTEALGGAMAIARRTGSRAFERFTGPQIRAFWRKQPEAYGETHRIHLVSSFLASALVCGDAPVDPGDGSGTNLMDLATSTWWPEALDATAPDLARRLPRIAPSHSIVGTLGRYWRDRYRLPSARVVAWSGDNPCSLIGTGLVREGRVAISLGTSDTIFGFMREPRVSESGEGHVFASPTGDFMGMTVFRNGSLARERVRDMYGLDWSGFSAALRSTPPGNNGAKMFPWFEPEITPHVPVPGVVRVNLDEKNAAANVRAVVEGQMTAMLNHSRWMGEQPTEIIATGGAAANVEILQVMAEVFGARVRRMDTLNSASLGAALRAWHADRLDSDEPISWDDVVKGI